MVLVSDLGILSISPRGLSHTVIVRADLLRLLLSLGSLKEPIVQWETLKLHAHDVNLGPGKLKRKHDTIEGNYWWQIS